VSDLEAVLFGRRLAGESACPTRTQGLAQQGGQTLSSVNPARAVRIGAAIIPARGGTGRSHHRGDRHRQREPTSASWIPWWATAISAIPGARLRKSPGELRRARPFEPRGLSQEGGPDHRQPCGRNIRPIWGTAFLRAGSAAGAKTELSGADVVAMLRAAVAGIQARGAHRWATRPCWTPWFRPSTAWKRTWRPAAPKPWLTPPRWPSVRPRELPACWPNEAGFLYWRAQHWLSGSGCGCDRSDRQPRQRRLARVLFSQGVMAPHAKIRQ